MFENFERQVDNFLNNSFKSAATILAVMGVSVYAVQDYAFEEWDNVPTEQTETVISELKQNISDLSDIKEEAKWLETRKTLAEHDNGAEWEIGSTPWMEHAVKEAKINNALDAQSKAFFEKAMTSQDIPEETWGDLANEFNTGNFSKDVSFSNPTKNNYVLRECQLEASANGSMGLSEQAKNIENCKADEEIGDAFGTLFVGAIGGTLLAGIGMIGTVTAAPSIQQAARRRREKKTQPKKQN